MTENDLREFCENEDKNILITLKIEAPFWGIFTGVAEGAHIRIKLPTKHSIEFYPDEISSLTVEGDDGGQRSI